MNVEKNTVDLLFEIFENCQLARYTPLNIDAMSDDYNKTKQFIEQLEKYQIMIFGQNEISTDKSSVLAQ